MQVKRRELEVAKIEMKNCPFCGSSEIDPEGWMNGAGEKGPECGGCGATARSVAIWNERRSTGFGTRMFINQPSRLQPLHDLHGKLVIAMPAEGLQSRTCYTIDGIVSSMEVPASALSSGWPERKKIYLYRRRGNTDWTTTDKANWADLAQHHLFDTKWIWDMSDGLTELVTDPAEGSIQGRFESSAKAMGFRPGMLGFKLDGSQYVNGIVQGMYEVFKANQDA